MSQFLRITVTHALLKIPSSKLLIFLIFQLLSSYRTSKFFAPHLLSFSTAPPKFLHLYTMFSFLVRTATRPCHTTRLPHFPMRTLVLLISLALTVNAVTPAPTHRRMPEMKDFKESAEKKTTCEAVTADGITLTCELEGTGSESSITCYVPIPQASNNFDPEGSFYTIENVTSVSGRTHVRVTGDTQREFTFSDGRVLYFEMNYSSSSI